MEGYGDRVLVLVRLSAVVVVRFYDPVGGANECGLAVDVVGSLLLAGTDIALVDRGGTHIRRMWRTMARWG